MCVWKEFSKNGGAPKSSMLIGFSRMKTIQLLGVPPWKSPGKPGVAGSRHLHLEDLASRRVEIWGPFWEIHGGDETWRTSYIYIYTHTPRCSMVLEISHLHLGPKNGPNVGKYSSTMEHLGILYSYIYIGFALETWWFGFTQLYWNISWRWILLTFTFHIK